ASNDGDHEAGRGHQAESEGECGFKRAHVDPHAVDVQKKIVEGGLRFLTLRFGLLPQTEAGVLYCMVEFVQVVDKFADGGLWHGVSPTRGSACPPGLRCRR